MELPKKTFRKVIKEDDEEVFNADELDKLMNCLSATPDIINLGILLMFCTGIRVGELVAIKWCDVFGNTIKIRRAEITYKNVEGQIVFEIKDYPKTRRIRYLVAFQSSKISNLCSDYLFDYFLTKLKRA